VADCTHVAGGGGLTGGGEGGCDELNDQFRYLDPTANNKRTLLSRTQRVVLIVSTQEAVAANILPKSAWYRRLLELVGRSDDGVDDLRTQVGWPD